MKYKAGDKIIVKEKFWEIKSDVYTNAFDGMKKLAGRKLEVSCVYDNGDVYTKQDDSKDDTRWCWDKDWIELYIEPSKEITWETLKWKDVVVDEGGDEIMVLGVLNDVVFTSETDEFNCTGTWYHKQELQSYGFTIKQPTPTPVEKPKETIEVGEHTYKLVK